MYCWSLTIASARRRWRLTGLVLVAAVATAGGAAHGAAKPAADRSGLALDPSQLVATLHQVNRMEISAGRIAQQNGAMPAVRDYGRTLVLDHQVADDQLTMYARSKGISLNDVPMAFRQQQQVLEGKLDKLKSMAGRSFDRQFALAMATAHGKVIAMIDASRPAVRDEGLVVLLDRLEPTLHKHRLMADNILNGNAGTASTTAPHGGTAQGRRGPGR